ncbi:MAG: hypothetical protein K8W52_00395 [Deltaproteobacteria bacterium]|nr:hypothetical protein [Deltaproteobacteria bacterium]
MKQIKKSLSAGDLKTLETAELAPATGGGYELVNGIPWDQLNTSIFGNLGNIVIKGPFVNGIPVGPVFGGG